MIERSQQRMWSGGLMLLALVLLPSLPVAQEPVPEPVTLHVFYSNIVHFTPDDPDRYDTPLVSAADNGRAISRTIDLPQLDFPVRIMAHVVVRPIPKDEQFVHDKWDRAGNVRLRRDGLPDLELVKFITAYGGLTEHELDVTHLAPVLQGRCTFTGFVDTWISPGWEMDFQLVFLPVESRVTPDWVLPVLYEEALTEENLRSGAREIQVQVPSGLRRFAMHYLVSGHCTDGRGADEFESKDNVITVDGQEVRRFKPWRDDCRRFREVNPYCRRWSDGSWSSDYSRSGWCPSDKVLPISIDLTEILSPGNHVVGFNVENVRPKDNEGNFGYWRVSSYLLGWKE